MMDIKPFQLDFQDETIGQTQSLEVLVRIKVYQVCPVVCSVVCPCVVGVVVQWCPVVCSVVCPCAGFGPRSPKGDLGHLSNLFMKKGFV